MAPAARHATRVRFRLLGAPDIEVDGAPGQAIPPKQRTLLAALLSTPGRVVSTQRLVAELWPDDPPTTAGAALQVHVAALRRVIGERLRTSGAGYLIDAGENEVDYLEFEALAGPGPAGEEKPETAQRLRAALSLWRGAAFEGVAGGLLVSSAAARLTQLRQQAREDLAELELSLGRHQELVAELSAWVVECPTAERLVRSLMLALYRCGRSGEALAAGDRLGARLAAEFATEPEAQTIALAAAIRRRDPSLDVVRPHLPTPASRFVGRRRELDQTAELLGRCRLLTVTGPGGSGKTRLAVELARETAPEYPGGAYLVELAGHPGLPRPVMADDAGQPVADSPRPPLGMAGPGAPEALAARVAALVGVREAPGSEPSESLARWIGERRMLLVLDNCEHVRTACAWLVAGLLARCSGLRILATSREPLDVDGEVVVPLAGLSLPDAGGDPAQALRTDAVRLLVERMTQARAGAGVRPGEEGHVIILVRRLDGLPLAIELAAARLRALSVPDMIERLDLDLLAGRSHIGRHRTMRAAIDWSYAMLEPGERALFRRLGVFAGDFDLAAAQAVGATGGSDVLDPLIRLVDRSLVTCDPSAPRPYRLIETMREYSIEQLAGCAEYGAVRRRHAEYYAALVSAPPPMDGPAHAAWLAAMSGQHDNIRAALGWSLDDGADGAASEIALTLATGMWWYWWVTGQMAEGRAWLDRAIQAAGEEASSLRGQALRAAASLARNSGDLVAARRLGERGLQAFRQLNDEAGIASALNNLCITAQGQGDFEASLEYGFEAIRRAEQSGPERAVAAALNNTAGTLRCLDRLDEAQAMFERALAGFRSLSDRRGEAAALSNLGVVARRRGELAQARALALSFLALYWELEIVEGQLDGVEALAYVDAFTDRPESAVRLLAIAARERTRLGAPIFTPDELADRRRAEEVARAALDEATLARASVESERFEITVRRLLRLDPTVERGRR